MRMEYETKEIEVTLIDEPQEAMRTDIPRDAVFALAADIQKNGLISPITVRRRGERYEVVAGHRRLLAHRFGGIARIKVIVRELTDAEAFAIMTSENLKREGVPLVDQAIHAARALEYCKGDMYAAAKMCGESEYWVETRIAISKLDGPFKDALQSERVSLGVALELAEIDNEADRASALEQAISQGQSVVVARYVVAQHKARLWGQNALGNPGGGSVAIAPPSQIMLRCAITDKEYPAEQMRSVLIATENIGYIESLREHLKSESMPAEPSPGDS